MKRRTHVEGATQSEIHYSFYARSLIWTHGGDNLLFMESGIEPSPPSSILSPLVILGKGRFHVCWGKRF